MCRGRRNKDYTGLSALLFWAILAGVAFLSSGCETINARISRNIEIFNTLAPEHQQEVQAGNIKVGFEPIEVYLAWGAPSYKSITENQQGLLETWIYTGTRSETRYRRRRHFDVVSNSWIYDDQPFYVHRDYMAREAVFLNNKVISYTLYPPLPLN